MTDIFLYEYITGGGTLSEYPSATPTGSMLREGGAMIRALAGDFSALPGVRVQRLWDVRLSSEETGDGSLMEVADAKAEREALRELARRADETVLIAPESGDALLDRARDVIAVGGRLLSPSPEFIAVASDKQQTAERLAAAGVATPLGRRWNPATPLPRDFPYPAVVKPLDGAGSLGVQWLQSADSPLERRDLGTTARLEQFCPGLAASVAVLCGPGQRVPLPACRQRLSTDGHFRYLGGETPLPEPLSCHAQRLALAALAVLPEATGYVGVDLVLGDEPDGRDDVVIEINPRLTTSYVGLRRLARVNLAAAMLALAQGRPADLSFGDRPVSFAADGKPPTFGPVDSL